MTGQRRVGDYPPPVDDMIPFKSDSDFRSRFPSLKQEYQASRRRVQHTSGTSSGRYDATHRPKPEPDAPDFPPTYGRP